MKQEWIYSYRLSDRIILGLSSRHTKAKYFWVQPNQNKFFDYISFIADCRPLACDHLNLGLELRIYTIQCNRNSNFLNQGLYDCYQKMNEPLSFPPCFGSADCIFYPHLKLSSYEFGSKRKKNKERTTSRNPPSWSRVGYLYVTRIIEHDLFLF